MNVIDRALRKLIPKNRLGDRLLSYRDFRIAHGRPPRIDGGFNDAIYFLKVSDEADDPLRVSVTCKAGVKDFARERIGDRYNVPTHAVLRSMAEVRAYDFPADCVIKPTHMSGQVIFRRNGSKIDFDRVADWFDSNYYTWTRERVYRSLKPMVIVEPYIFGGVPEDFKIFCVHGEPRMIWVDVDRHTAHKRNLYTTDWQMIDAALAHENAPTVERPAMLDEMLRIARSLSQGFSLLRVDLYTDGRQVLLGELTHFSGDARDKILHGEEEMTRVLFGGYGVRGFLASARGRREPKIYRPISASRSNA